MIFGRSWKPSASASMSATDEPGMPPTSSEMRATEFGAVVRLAASWMSVRRSASEAVTAARSAATPLALSNPARSSTSEHAVRRSGARRASGTRRCERCFMPTRVGARVGSRRLAPRVVGMARCVDTSLYVAGEKVPLLQYAVLVRDGKKWTSVDHWRELPDEATEVVIVPVGAGEKWREFPEAVWRGSTSRTLSKGRKGRSAGRGWADADSTAVLVMRAHGEHARVPGSGPARDVLLASFATGLVREDVARACVVSPDAQIRTAALGEVVLRVGQVAALASSPTPVLRAVGARLTTDENTLMRLLDDSETLVQRAALANRMTPAEVLEAFAKSSAFAYDVALHPNTPEHVLGACVRSGELASRAAIAHPRMAEFARYALTLGMPNEVFAASNPEVDAKVALWRAREHQGVASSLGRNALAVSRLNEVEVLELVGMLQRAGDRVGVTSVCRAAVLSEEAQVALLQDGSLGEVAGVGLAGNPSLTDAAAELLLVTSDVFEPEARSLAMQRMASNRSVHSRYLARVPLEDPVVARALLENATASGSTQERAREMWSRSMKQHEVRVRKAMQKRGTRPTPAEKVVSISPTLLPALEKRLAVVALRDEALEGRIAMHPSWGVQRWGAEVFEVRTEYYPDGEGGAVAQTQIVMRVNEKKMAATAGANPRVDPLGVCITHDGVEYFTMLEPLGRETGEEATLGAELAGDVEEVRDALKRHMKKVDWRGAAMSGLKHVPGGPELLALNKAAKKLAQVEQSMLGTPRGADRVAVAWVDASDGTATMRVLAAEFARHEAVEETKNFVRDLERAGELTTAQSVEVRERLENLEFVASLADDRRSWAWAAREKMRFRAGQRDVVERLLSGDVPWEYEELLAGGVE